MKILRLGTVYGFNLDCFNFLFEFGICDTLNSCIQALKLHIHKAGYSFEGCYLGAKYYVERDNSENKMPVQITSYTVYWSHRSPLSLSYALIDHPNVMPSFGVKEPASLVLYN